MKFAKIYRPLHEWKNETTLVPFSGVQHLDFGFDIDAVNFRSMAFVERVTRHSEAHDTHMLIPLTGDETRDDERRGEPLPEDDEYSISKTRALEPFLEKWTPAPVFRIASSAGPRGDERYDTGPTDWSRVLVKELPERDQESGHTHRVILAFDTTCETARADDVYASPVFEDGEREFRFVSDPDHMSWFLRRVVTQAAAESDVQAWVNDWIEAYFLDLLRQRRPDRKFDLSELPHRSEHWARYLAFVALLDRAVRFPKIRLIDTLALHPQTKKPRYEPVDVDLVLDVGSSRTSGIMIETLPGSTTIDLNDSYQLALRDLSNPLFRYTEPFESRVEFADTTFGPRDTGFLWPSLVRVGPEAVRMTRDEDGSETTSGMSSPKRYLWDDVPASQDWRFHFFKPTANVLLPQSVRAVLLQINQNGDVLDQVAAEEAARLRRRGETSLVPATRPRFSRSSIYGLMIAEILLHAYTQINDPAQREARKESPIPRRLRRIILTLPSATPIQERAIMRSRVEGALKLIFSVLGWHEGLAVNTRPPEVIVDWDEATCTQLVYLYTEITQKFAGQMRDFFQLAGTLRQRPPSRIAPARALTTQDPEPSLRIACIDIGGGTTDLMVSTFYQDDNRALTPRQDFREGFKIAGDDILGEVITRILLPMLEAAMARAGAESPEGVTRELFGGGKTDVAVQHAQRRRQFVSRVLRPVALEYITRAETLSEGEIVKFLAGDALGWAPETPTDSSDPATNDPTAPPPRRVSSVPTQVLTFLEEPARLRGAQDWSLPDVEIVVDRTQIDRLVEDVLRKPLSDMSEIIGHLACDVTLLTGRPSRLPAVRGLMREMLVTRPSRLVSMHDYKVGPWYPYRDPVTNRIHDPKSTAVVGAMICALAKSKIENFMMFTDEIMMASTARFIGEMEKNDIIFVSKVLFSEGQSGRESPTVAMYAPTFIGFRQLPHERWTTTVLYKLDFKSHKAAETSPKPLRVTLKPREIYNDAESPDEALKAEALKEIIEVETVEDANGGALKPREDISLRLHTLGRENDYWLDSGVFRFG